MGTRLLYYPIYHRLPPHRYEYDYWYRRLFQFLFCGWPLAAWLGLVYRQPAVCRLGLLIICDLFNPTGHNSQHSSPGKDRQPKVPTAECDVPTMKGKDWQREARRSKDEMTDQDSGLRQQDWIRVGIGDFRVDETERDFQVDHSFLRSPVG